MPNVGKPWSTENLAQTVKEFILYMFIQDLIILFFFLYQCCHKRFVVKGKPRYYTAGIEVLAATDVNDTFVSIDSLADS